MPVKPELAIEYCVECGYLPDAATLAEKMLLQYASKLSAVKLVPGSKGAFEVSFDGDLVFSRGETRRFPEIAEMRDIIKEKLQPKAAVST